MVFESPRRRCNDDYMNFRHHSLEEPLLPIGYENALFDLQSECNFRENSYTSDDVLEDDFSLINGSGGIYDNSSWLKFDNYMEDRREPLENMFSKYENMMTYRRKCELEDIIMKEKIIRSQSQSNLNNLQHVYKGNSRLYCPGGAVLIMPNGEIHLTPPGEVVPTIDVRMPRGHQTPVPFSPMRQNVDQTLKKQWCARRNSSPYFANSDASVRTLDSVRQTPIQFTPPRPTLDRTLKNQWCSRRNGSPYFTNSEMSLRTPDKRLQKVEKPSSYRSPMDCQPPNYPEDDELIPLKHKTIIKVRNVHPTACLHELHVQSRELFPKKPTFDTRKLAKGKQKKGSFVVLCKFEFNGARMYTHHTEQTKSDAKMNASRNMLRKLKSIQNLSIVLDDERTNSGAFASFEHPRCQLLHLHDTNPEMYPLLPTFQPSLWRTLPRNRNKARCINMICHFQVGQERLATIGAANNKKQAIVQAARNMLKRLFPCEESVKDSQAENDQNSERMKTPWTCHFCKIFMTGRKPFLAHLSGRSHIQRMSELELNAEVENKILHAAAEEAWKKKEEVKRKAALKSCDQRESEQLQSDKNGEFYNNNSAMNSSSQDSQDSEEGTCKNASTSSSLDKSEFETS